MYVRLSYTIISTPEGTVSIDYCQVSYLLQFAQFYSKNDLGSLWDGQVLHPGY